MNTSIKVTPLRRYAEPKYPTKRAALRDPSILRHVPHRWAKNAAVLTAFGLTLSLAGCDVADGLLTPSEEPPVRSGDYPVYAGVPVAPDDSEALYAIAPVFEHGLGIGSIGCVSVAAPLFLSEEEAFEIIRAEAESAGLVFGSSDLPAPREVNWGEELGSHPVTFDGFDAELGIAFEFVSQQDVQGMQEPPNISVESFDMKAAAETLRASLESDAPAMTVATFYDPNEFDYDKYQELYNEYVGQYYADGFDWENATAAERNEYEQRHEAYRAAWEEYQRELLTENLRLQVRDFIDWMKAEGLL